MPIRKPWIQPSEESIRAIPAVLGVYEIADAEGNLLYIGQAEVASRSVCAPGWRCTSAATIRIRASRASGAISLGVESAIHVEATRDADAVPARRRR